MVVLIETLKDTQLVALACLFTNGNLVLVFKNKSQAKSAPNVGIFC